MSMGPSQAPGRGQSLDQIAGIEEVDLNTSFGHASRDNYFRDLEVANQGFDTQAIVSEMAQRATELASSVYMSIDEVAQGAGSLATNETLSRLGSSAAALDISQAVADRAKLQATSAGQALEREQEMQLSSDREDLDGAPDPDGMAQRIPEATAIDIKERIAIEQGMGVGRITPEAIAIAGKERIAREQAVEVPQEVPEAQLKGQGAGLDWSRLAIKVEPFTLSPNQETATEPDLLVSAKLEAERAKRQERIMRIYSELRTVA